MAATNRPAAAEKRAPTRRAPAKPKPDPAKTAEPETELGGEGAAPPADIVAADALTITTTPWIPSRRVVIFYVDGKPYSVPETPPANWALNYMDAIRRHGELIASTWLMETMLGTEGYNATGVEVLGSDYREVADPKAVLKADGAELVGVMGQMSAFLR